MIIQVTQKHIDKGQQNNAIACPIALALKENNIKSCTVSPQYIYIRGDKEYLYEVTTEIAQWITYFDNGLTVEPFEFDLSLLVKYEIQKITLNF